MGPLVTLSSPHADHSFLSPSSDTGGGRGPSDHAVPRLTSRRRWRLFLARRRRSSLTPSRSSPSSTRARASPRARRWPGSCGEEHQAQAPSHTHGRRRSHPSLFPGAVASHPASPRRAPHLRVRCGEEVQPRPPRARARAQGGHHRRHRARAAEVNGQGSSCAAAGARGGARPRPPPSRARRELLPPRRACASCSRDFFMLQLLYTDVATMFLTCCNCSPS
jgi:hypothetical protein